MATDRKSPAKSVGERGSIGIVTLPGLFNYGNRLQCYAVFSIYKRMGFAPEVIERRKSRAKRIIKKLIGRSEQTREELMDAQRLARFQAFNELMIRKSVTWPYWPLSHRYKFCSVGSDQTWNPEWVSKDADWYFLRFVRRRQRIALAPSIGIDHLDGKGARVIAKGVRGFERLSVRERRGAELIHACCGRDASVICDPTLVLSVDDWRGVSSDDLTPSDPYVFSYVLGKGESAAKVIELASSSGEVDVVVLSDGSGNGELPVGPAEFISLIDKAEHVITDSFHAAVFASILQTPLSIVRREGGSSMFSRLEQLCQMLGIEHKIYGSPDFDISRAGDYRGVAEAIERERGKFMSYLEGCLNA